MPVCNNYLLLERHYSYERGVEPLEGKLTMSLGPVGDANTPASVQEMENS